MPARRFSFVGPVLLPLALLVWACSHGEPFAPGDQRVDGPLVPGVVEQLTYSTAADRSPAWLGDSSIIYSFTSTERFDDDCLAVLPEEGGTRQLTLCNPDAVVQGTYDWYYQPAPRDGDTLALLLRRSPSATADGATGIAISSLADIPGATMLRTLPFASAGGFIDEIRGLRWLTRDSLIFLGRDIATYTPCATCDPLSFPRWRYAFRLGTSSGAAAELIPGTGFATSAAPGITTGELIVTYANDGRVYSLDAASGTLVRTVADLGPDAAARDADYAAGRVAVIIHGKVRQLMADDGPAQTADEGGLLVIVDITTGAIRTVNAPGVFFRAPRLNRDASVVVAEGHPYLINVTQVGSEPAVIDTVVSPAGDLYRISLQ